VDIGRGDALHSLVTRWREALAAGSGAGGAAAARRAEALGDSLRRLAWDRVAPRVAGTRRVFVVPDGDLCEVNLAALPAGRGRFLLETGPTLHYLSTERDLLPREAVEAPARGLLAIGGVDFDARASVPALFAVAAEPARAGAPARNVQRAADCSVFRTERFAPLPGSSAEVSDVDALWRARTPGAGAAVVLTGPQATEQAFRAGARGHSVVHVATHAFFIDGDCAPRTARTGSPLTAGGTLPYIVRENPLLLSGLVLAGANHHAEARPGADDGLLTAEEIAGLDLRGTEWVVLSACETGLGVVHPGEGILGLRRAFAIAGARTLITSLWKVPDAAAEDWMRELYRARFEEHLDTAAAMRRASLQLLHRLRERGAEPDPRLWGAFIATGDWR
jgi:CHAT domain-containing protein